MNPLFLLDYAGVAVFAAIWGHFLARLPRMLLAR